MAFCNTASFVDSHANTNEWTCGIVDCEGERLNEPSLMLKETKPAVVVTRVSYFKSKRSKVHFFPG
jgi:hypothetical protein